MSAVTARSPRPHAIRRADHVPDLLPHWSEVSPRRPLPVDVPPHAPVPPKVAAMLLDLVSWAADLGIALTHDAPEERTAIEEVRDYARAWLVGGPRPEVRAEDVLTMAATILSAIDLDVGRRDLRARNTNRRAACGVIERVAA
jgi:hypothetical protein